MIMNYIFNFIDSATIVVCISEGLDTIFKRKTSKKYFVDKTVINEKYLLENTLIYL